MLKYIVVSFSFLFLISCGSIATQNSSDNTYDDNFNNLPKETNTTVAGSPFIKKTSQRGSLADFDDGYYEKGVDTNYSRRDDILIDNIRSLEWQDDIRVGNITKPWVTQTNYDIGDYDNTDGDTATTYCKNLSLDGDGWRLPTAKELRGVEYDNSRDYIFNNMAPRYLTKSKYWSGTSYSYSYNLVWVLWKTLEIDYKNSNYYIRCVRDINSTDLNTTRFIKIGDIVRDNLTKLDWQDSIKSEKMSWKDALNYCENLSLEGYNDWNLPNQHELFSIVDYSRNYPAIYKEFQNTYIDKYWSSSRDLDTHLSDFVGFVSLYKSFHRVIINIDFADGTIYETNDDDNDKYVRCVRTN